MISVIVPVYKVEKYLEKCLMSIRNQTYTDLEIILIDDGSPDCCGAICDDMAAQDKRIVVIHQPNGGLSSARNRGLEIATGEYIAFIDSDDYVTPDYFEKMIKAITDENADMCMCGSVCIDEDGNILYQDLLYEEKCFTGSQIVNFFVLNLKTAVWNKLFRKSLIGNVRFPEGRIHGEDLVFFISLLQNDITLITVNNLGYYYVKHSDSITTGMFSEKAFDEVYCKDLAHSMLTEKFPEFSSETFVWRFRARMNLIRKIVLFNKRDFVKEYEQYRIWVKKNYCSIKKYLSYKERIEYILYLYFFILYKRLIKVVMRKSHEKFN